MAERRYIKAFLVLVLVLSLLHYSAEEEEARCRCSCNMESKGKKSFEMGNCNNRRVFTRKHFNPVVIAISGVYAGVALFWVAFAFLCWEYLQISTDDFAEYDIMSRPRIRSRNHKAMSYWIVGAQAWYTTKWTRRLKNKETKEQLKEKVK